MRFERLPQQGAADENESTNIIETAGPYSDIDAHREMFQAEAEVENSKRAIWDRLRGRKVTASDKAQERAKNLNERIQESFTDDPILQEDAYREIIDQIQTEDSFRLRSPEEVREEASIGRAIDKVLLTIAVTAGDSGSRGDKVRMQYEDAYDLSLKSPIISEMFRTQCVSRLESGVQEYRDQLRAPAVSDVLATLGDALHYYSDVEEFVRRRDWWDSKGVIKSFEINQLDFVKQAAANHIKQNVVHPAYQMDIDLFIKKRHAWVTAGVLSEKEVNELPEIRNKAFQELIELKHRSQHAEQIKKELLEAGLVTAEDIEEYATA